MSQKHQRILQNVVQLLRQNRIREAPVDVEAIASSLGIEVRRAPAEDDMSGFLLRNPDGTAVIGVNALHHPNRQRFTIGHEIGHFVLHRYDEVHVDKVERFVLRLRSGISSTGEDQEEIEANRFAAELLMPMEFLEKDLPKYAIKGLLDDRGMAQWAKRYGVSVQALTNRLISVGFIYDGDLH
jgi:Zn-dependent peptidase ImmA (M78 family)